MKLLNLTPHEVNIILPSGAVAIPPEDVPMQLVERYQHAGRIEGIPVKALRYGSPINLPEPKLGQLLIVSSIARHACGYRFDLVTPADLVRDDEGRVIGAKCLAGNAWIAGWL